MFKIEKMDFLVSFYIFGIIVSELMGGKTFPIIHLGSYPLNGSVAILLLPFIFTINDVITEVHGAERARSVARSGLFMIVLLFIFILIAVSLPPSMRFQETNAAYKTIFGTSARIAISSLTAFAIADFTDIIIFTKLRKKLGKSKLWLRNNLSNFISQFIDTAVFMTLAFYAFDKSFTSNWIFLVSLIIPYWLLKCSMSVIETPLVYVGVKWLKKDK